MSDSAVLSKLETRLPYQSIVEHQDRIIRTLDRFGNNAELPLSREF